LHWRPESSRRASRDHALQYQCFPPSIQHAAACNPSKTLGTDTASLRACNIFTIAARNQSPVSAPAKALKYRSTFFLYRFSFPLFWRLEESPFRHWLRDFSDV